MPSSRPPGRPCLGVNGRACRKVVRQGSRCASCKRAQERDREGRKLVTRKVKGQRTGSTRAWRVIRHRILRRDGFRCTHVGPEGRCEARTGLHVDHVVPRSKGGPDVDENLRTLCQAHNLAKGART